MAIVQISRIQHRRGLKEQLPQLAAGELGWAVDSQELYIGNGTTAEGAPEVGNTKIITEDDNLLSTVNTYVFRGNTDNPVVTGASGDVQRTLQQKLDDRVSVKDFGAVGDGVTDDAAAINRAIKNTFTVDSTTAFKERRTLYFPGGVYKVGSVISIYPHATIVGDGPTSTIFESDSASLNPVFQFVDRNGQSQANIGSGGYEIPNGIRMQGICFKTTHDQNLMRIDQTRDLHFDNCHWLGAYVNQTGQTNGYALIELFGTVANVTKRIHFAGCTFEGLEYAVESSDNIEDLVFSSCEFLKLYRAFNLAEQSDGSTLNKTIGPTGVVIFSSRFDGIDAEAVKLYDNGGSPRGNIVSGCSFRDVGKNSDDSAELPEISFLHGNNRSDNNFFHRTDVRSNFEGTVYSESPPRVPAVINDNASSKANLVNPDTSANVQFDLSRENFIEFDYTLTRGTARRNGTMTIAGTPTGVHLDDSFTENAATGVTFFVDSSGTIQYTSTNTSTTGTFKYREIRFL